MILQIIIYLFFTVGGLVFMKLGSENVSLVIKASKISFSCNAYLILGLMFYLASFVMWTMLLKGNKLTFIVPLTTGLSQILIFACGVAIFNDKVDPLKLLAIVVIVAGVILLNIK